MWNKNSNKNSTITCNPKIEEKNIIEGKSVFQAAEEIVTGNEITNIKENDLTLFDIIKNGPCNKQKPKVVVKDIIILSIYKCNLGSSIIGLSLIASDHIKCYKIHKLSSEMNKKLRTQKRRLSQEKQAAYILFLSFVLWQRVYQACSISQLGL